MEVVRTEQSNKAGTKRAYACNNLAQRPPPGGGVTTWKIPRPREEDVQEVCGRCQGELQFNSGYCPACADAGYAQARDHFAIAGSASTSHADNPNLGMVTTLVRDPAYSARRCGHQHENSSSLPRTKKFVTARRGRYTTKRMRVHEMYSDAEDFRAGVKMSWGEDF